MHDSKKAEHCTDVIADLNCGLRPFCYKNSRRRYKIRHYSFVNSAFQIWLFKICQDWKRARTPHIYCLLFTVYFKLQEFSYRKMHKITEKLYSSEKTAKIYDYCRNAGCKKLDIWVVLI